MKQDQKGLPCQKCKKGTYGERSLYDDWDGTQTCNKCGHKVPRWKERPDGK